MKQSPIKICQSLLERDGDILPLQYAFFLVRYVEPGCLRVVQMMLIFTKFKVKIV